MAKSNKTVRMLADVVGGSVVGPGTETVITDVTHDSRQAGPGSLYVAVRGSHVDGHDFASAAVSSGAAAICVDHPLSSGVPEIVVEDTRRTMGRLASAVHDYPSRSLSVVGVTGTNGKTTVTHYVESIAGRAGLRTGLVGTIHTRAGGDATPSTLTTPEGPELQRLLGEMRDRDVDLVAVEVSSHALELGRVEGTRFAVAAYTNISQDHLDFHGDMAAYEAAKERLFTDYEVGTAVINIDDPWGAEIAARYRGNIITVGRGGDFSVRSVKTHPAHSQFVVETQKGAFELDAPVVGEFNVANLVLASACSVAVGIELDEVFAAATEVAGVPGRFEVVSGDDPISVIVDYAHTPEGVATVVETARRLSPGRVIALLGAGGDRDRAKRPAMGEALSRADFAIVTSDNPRTEEPAAIVSAVVSGITAGAEHLVELDRRRAIDRAIDEATDGDVVLVLGRGHEPMQDLGTEKVAFDDREVAAASLRRRKSVDYGPGSGSMTE